MTYYIPAYEDTGASFGIKEIDSDYFKDPIKENIIPYAKDFVRIIGAVDVSKFLKKWNLIVEEIGKRDGKLLYPSEIIPEWPEEIFGLQGKMFCYLNTAGELTFIKDYSHFRILQIYGKKTMLFKHGQERVKRVLEYNSDKEFITELNKWIQKNKLRFEVNL